MKSLSLAVAVLFLYSLKTVGQRAAFVIGINNYQDGDALTKCLNDADSMSFQLHKYGFIIHADSNLNNTAFKKNLKSWYPIMKNAKDIAFYFSGHGFAIGENEFMETTNFEEKNFANLPDITIDLYSILESIQDIENMRDSKLQNVLIFLDACRDFPSKEDIDKVRAILNLTPHKPDNMFIGFAALPGNQASSGPKMSEGGGPNSLFTQAILSSIEKNPQASSSGLENDIRTKLKMLTSGLQVMEGSNTLSDFQFSRPCSACIVPVPQPHRCQNCNVDAAKELFDVNSFRQTYNEVAGYNGGPLKNIGNNQDGTVQYASLLVQSRMSYSVHRYLNQHDYPPDSYNLQNSYVVYTFKDDQLQNVQLYLKYQDFSFYTHLSGAFSVNLNDFPGILFLGPTGDFRLGNRIGPTALSGFVFGNLAEYDYSILEFGAATQIAHDPEELYKFENVFKKLEISKIPAYRFGQN
jgi:hypothetical protein